MKPKEWTIHGATTEGNLLELGATFGAFVDTECLVLYLDHVSDFGYIIPLDQLEPAIADWRKHGHGE